MPAAYRFCAKTISRAKGQSTIASIAYRSGQKLLDERIGKSFDYTRRHGVELIYHAAPKDAPSWAHQIESAWNQIEAIETRKNASVARE